MTTSSYESRVGALAPTTHRIDLRSDTVTHPTPAMREAMYHAEVGDDVYGEDPPSTSWKSWRRRGWAKRPPSSSPQARWATPSPSSSTAGAAMRSSAGDRAHIFLYEVGGAARLNGSPIRAIPTLPDGTLDREKLAGSFFGDDVHEARTGLLCLEDTHNMCGGRVHRAGDTARTGRPGAGAQVARAYGRRAHLQRRHRARHPGLRAGRRGG